jgi:hypothetical protein
MALTSSLVLGLGSDPRCETCAAERDKTRIESAAPRGKLGRHSFFQPVVGFMIAFLSRRRRAASLDRRTIR